MNPLVRAPIIPLRRERSRLPLAALTLSAPQNVNNGATATVALDTILVDTDGLADTTNNRLTLKGPAVYCFEGLARVSSVATNSWAVNLEVDAGDGGGFLSRCLVQPTVANVDFPLSAIVPTFVAANPLARLRVTNNSGGAANITAASLWGTQVA